MTIRPSARTTQLGIALSFLFCVTASAKDAIKPDAGVAVAPRADG